MNKAVFLDRDGTINVDKHYMYRIEDFEFLPGALEGLKLLSDTGFLLIVITNQSGIARGYYTEEDYKILNGFFLDRCKEYGIEIADSLYCPHLPDAKIPRYRVVCECRKPATGLFLDASNRHNIDISASYAIGDKMRDLSICEKTGCRGYLIVSNERQSSEKSKIPCIKNCSSLLEAAEDIIGYLKGERTD